jgi:hypothetical protein
MRVKACATVTTQVNSGIKAMTVTKLLRAARLDPLKVLRAD